MALVTPVAEVVSVDKAGRVVIPKAVREATGIDERVKLLVAAAGRGRVVLQKLDVEEIVARLEQELAGKDVEEIARRVREEVNARVRKAYPDLPP